MLRISIVLNEDHSGLTYFNEFEVSTEIFGKSIDQIIKCDMMSDQRACQEDMPIIVKQLQQNSTINFVFVLKLDDILVYRAIYSPEIAEPQIQKALIYIYNDRICIKYEPYTSEQVIVKIIIGKQSFYIQSKTDTKIDMYCNQLAQVDDESIRYLVKQKERLSATVNINNEVINNVPVVILQSEKHPYFVWIIAAIVILLTFGSVLIISQCQK
ncbi:Conserved_hypothetical protein [Hexamita inflata]|nr:Conserved hypothetical protein [Hexamita inflata]